MSIPPLNDNSFDFYVFKELKQFQYNWECYGIFPNEIISMIMVTLAYISIHPNNICDCKEIKCIDNWNMIMKYKELDVDQGVMHCGGGEYDNDTDIDIYCHSINLNGVERYQCDYCEKYFCGFCIYVHDPDHIIDESQLICSLCRPIIYPGLKKKLF